MLLSISHITRYTYDAPVPYALQQVRLTPKSRAQQTVHNWEMTIDGGQVECAYDDQHNNHVLLVSAAEDSHEITIHCSGEVETRDTNAVVGEHGGYAPLWFFSRATKLTKPGPVIQQLADGIDINTVDPIPGLHALSNAIAERVTYETGKTHTATRAEEALTSGHGVCQDHAHIFISAARALSVPAR